MRFTRQLVRVSRGENPIVAATFGDGPAAPVDGPVERVRLEGWPGILARRRFDCIVGLDLLDTRNCSSVLAEVYELLVPGGQVVVFESNLWNSILKLRRLAARLLRGQAA